MQSSVKNSSNNQSIWNISFVILAIFIPMLLIWLFMGEINLSQNNWLVAEYGKKWGEVIKTTEAGIDTFLGFGINDGGMMVSWEPFIASLGILVFDIILYFILCWWKKIKITFLAFIISFWVMFFVIIVSGLLYSKENSGADFAWKITVRIISSCVGFIIPFLIVNSITNIILSNSRWADQYAKEIINNEYETKEYIKENIDNLKYNKKNKKPRTIEVKDIKKKK